MTIEEILVALRKLPKHDLENTARANAYHETMELVESRFGDWLKTEDVAQAFGLELVGYEFELAKGMRP